MMDKDIATTKDTNQSLALAQAAYAWQQTVVQSFPQFSYEHALIALKLYVESREDEKKANVEKNLYLQAHVLDSLFKAMTARALKATGVQTAETYLKLALRAQNRYVRTTEAISSLHASPAPTVAIQINNQDPTTQKISAKQTIIEGKDRAQS